MRLGVMQSYRKGNTLRIITLSRRSPSCFSCDRPQPTWRTPEVCLLPKSHGCPIWDRETRRELNRWGTFFFVGETGDEAALKMLAAR